MGWDADLDAIREDGPAVRSWSERQMSLIDSSARIEFFSPTGTDTRAAESVDRVR